MERHGTTIAAAVKEWHKLLARKYIYTYFIGEKWPLIYRHVFYGFIYMQFWEILSSYIRMFHQLCCNTKVHSKKTLTKWIQEQANIQCCCIPWQTDDDECWDQRKDCLKWKRQFIKECKSVVIFSFGFWGTQSKRLPSGQHWYDAQAWFYVRIPPESKPWWHRWRKTSFLVACWRGEKKIKKSIYFE